MFADVIGEWPTHERVTVPTPNAVCNGDAGGVDWKLYCAG